PAERAIAEADRISEGVGGVLTCCEMLESRDQRRVRGNVVPHPAIRGNPDGCAKCAAVGAKRLCSGCVLNQQVDRSDAASTGAVVQGPKGLRISSKVVTHDVQNDGMRILGT